MKTETKIAIIVIATCTALLAAAIIYGFIILDLQEQSYEADKLLLEVIEKNVALNVEIVEAIQLFEIQIQTLEHKVDSLENISKLIKTKSN